jgi:hypothetical protein
MRTPAPRTRVLARFAVAVALASTTVPFLETPASPRAAR